MTAREQILGSLRRSLHRDALPEARQAELRARIAAHRPGLVPARGRVPHAEQIEMFIAMAQEVAASVTRVASAAEVPAAVADYLARQNLPARLVAAPGLDGIDWSQAPLLSVRSDIATPEDPVSVTPVFAGIAETGTLMLLSGPDSPTTLNFLPDTHIALLHAEDIVGTYEEAWTRLRAGKMPRTVNMVTGPSRTGDIEQTIQLGAHGPRRLHVVVVDGRRQPQ